MYLVVGKPAHEAAQTNKQTNNASQQATTDNNQTFKQNESDTLTQFKGTSVRARVQPDKAVDCDALARVHADVRGLVCRRSNERQQSLNAHPVCCVYSCVVLRGQQHSTNHTLFCFVFLGGALF